MTIYPLFDVFVYVKDIHLETCIQTTVIIEYSAPSAYFVDDNPIVSTEVCSSHIEPWAYPAEHRTVPSENAYMVPIGNNEIFSV